MGNGLKIIGCCDRRLSPKDSSNGCHSDTVRFGKPPSCRRNRNSRRGAATVEFALVAPLFILLVFGMIEFGRMTMVKQVIINASREGARQAVVEGTTIEEIKDVVETYMTASHVPVNREDIEISADPETAVAGDPIEVRVWVPYDEVSWLPSAMYLSGSRLTASSVMRKEGIQ